jgi:hypothetical protein
MTTPKQKKQALEYIAGLLEASGIYSINGNTPSSISFQENNWASSEPKQFELLIANLYTSITAFTSRCNFNLNQNIWTIPMLYKDQTTSYVRLAEKQSWRADQSLKLYTLEQINQMLHLRGIEKKVLELFGNPLSYYQPKTERLEQSIRQFELQPVHLDYNHLRPGDQAYGFVTNRDSVDYKLPLETLCITTALAVEPIAENDSQKRARLTVAEIMKHEIWDSMHNPSLQDIEKELRRNAQHAYPHLNPDEAYRVYCGGEE